MVKQRERRREKIENMSNPPLALRQFLVFDRLRFGQWKRSEGRFENLIPALLFKLSESL